MNFLDEIEPRALAAFALRFLAGAVPIPRDARAIEGIAGELARRFATEGAVAGLAADPSFPGASAGLERIGDRSRIVFACRLRASGVLLGVALTVVLEGRPIEITLAPPSTPIPKTWTTASP